MQRITREQARKYAFDWRDEPLLRVKPGETFEIETYDASTGYFKTPEDKAIPGKRPGFDRVPPLANPIGGPVCVEGAERGDTLVVTHRGHRRRRLLVDRHRPAARPARRIDALAGAVRASTRRRSSATRRARAARRATARCTSATGSRWPITPFIGTLGVAPDREVTTSLDGQGEWGGNLDIRDVAPGQPHLPAGLSTRGRCFYLGDVHASQGDTEFTGTAAETKATVRLQLDLIKGKRDPVDADREAGRRSSSVYAYRPLEVAVETATINLMDWLITRLRLHADRRLLPGEHLPGLPHQRLPDVQGRALSYVAGAEIPKRYLSGQSA